MKDKKILPPDLLEEVQKYIQGEYLYIPKATGSRKKWGEKSGARQVISERNKQIRYEFSKGTPLEELADKYYLSVSSMQKIIYKKQTK